MGVPKYRSLVNYADIITSNRGGIATGLEADTFVRKEAVQRTFNAPRVGTVGSSIGAASASTDISAGSDDSFNINIAGEGAVLVTLTLAGLITGSAIEAEMETKINAALAAAGSDRRVWVNFDGGDDHYEIYDQSTGTTSTVVITDAGANNVADDLNIGVANGGTETAGTNDQDYFLKTTGDISHNQPIDPDPHRTGRFHTGILKRKIVSEFSWDSLLNMSGDAGDSLDNAVRLLWESIFGTETVVAAQHIQYTQGLPNFTFSAVKIGTIHGEYFTGAYAKDMTLTAPGDAEVTLNYTGMAEKGSIAGLGQIDGAVASNTLITLDANHWKRFLNEGTNKARLMVVSADGRTITAGHDGSLTLESVDSGAGTITVGTAVDAEDDGFIVPWHPGAIQATSRLNPATDLEGSIKLTSTGDEICATNIELGYVNDHVDLNNCFGTKANQGFVAANKATITLGVTVDLSNENFGDIVQTRTFDGFDPVLTIGDTTTRHLEITSPKWIVEVPAIELPENGVVPVTLTGNFFQSSPGARDPIRARFK